MPRKVLILTVGGSDEPLVSSIKKNRADFVYFICSDDSPEASKPASYLTAVGEDKPCGNVYKCDACGNVKGEKRVNVVKQVGLQAGNYEVIKIKHFDDINSCYLAAIDIIKEVRSKDPDVEIVADYTGGTKSMTAGLAAAVMDDGNVKLCIVDGERYDLKSVKDGTQAARIIDSNKVMVEKKLSVIKNLLQDYYYQACLFILDEIYERPLAAEMHVRLEKVRFYCLAFESWDRFDHDRANDYMGIIRNSVPTKYKQFLGRIIQCKKVWAKLKNTGSVRDMRHLVTFDPVYDLILNARRRARQGRYDDAVARLYRALEMFGQLNLLKWDEPLHTNDLELMKLPADLRDEYAAQHLPGKPEITLGLVQSFTLLSKLKTSVGKVYEQYHDELLYQLAKRNNSLMAHGITPVEEVSCIEMLSFVDEFISACFQASNEKSGLDTALQFPDKLPE